MSRDLGFWRIKDKTKVENSQTYNDLTEGKYLEYISDLPSEQILQDFKEIFKDWRQLDDLYFANENEEFQLLITKQFVRADCYSMTERSLNKIIDILLKYDCPLYDALIGVRFDDE